MLQCQMYLQADAAYTAIAQLGELGIVQFKDVSDVLHLTQTHSGNDVRGLARKKFQGGSDLRGLHGTWSYFPTS